MSNRAATRFGVEVASVLTVQILSFGIGLVTSATIARLLGPGGKGATALAALVSSLGMTLLMLGVDGASIFYLGKGEHKLGEILGTVLGFVAAVSLTLFVVSPLLMDKLVVVMAGNVERGDLRLAVLMIPLRLLMGSLLAMFLGLQHLREWNLLALCQRIALLAAVGLVLLLGSRTVSRVLQAYIVSFAIVDIVALAYLSRRVVNLRFGRGILGKLLNYGLRAYPASLMRLLNLRLDVFLVNLFAGVVSTGYYIMAVTIAELIWYLPSATSTVLFPRIAATHSDAHQSAEFTQLVCRQTLLLSTLAGLALCLLGPTAVRLVLGEVYLPSIQPLRLLLPGVVCLSVSKVLYSDLAGRGLPQYATYSGIVVLSITLVGDLVLMPRFGISGAAIASSAAYCAAALLAVTAFSRVVRLPWIAVFIPGRADIQLYRRGAGCLRTALSRR